MKTIQTAVTPEYAKMLLDSVVTNRNINQDTVKQYASDMEAGRWYQNGIPIVLAQNDDGTQELIDGQHRCAAVIRYGKPIMFEIKVIPRDQAKGYDMNRVRKTQDIVKLEGYTQAAFRSSQIIAAVTLLIKLGKKERKPSRFEVIEAMAKMEDAVCYVYSNIHGAKKSLSKSSFLAAAITVYENGYPFEKLDRFMECVRDGIMKRPEDETAIRLRNYLIMNPSYGERAQIETYNTVLNALYNYEHDSIIKQIKTAKIKYPYPKHCTSEGGKA